MVPSQIYKTACSMLSVYTDSQSSLALLSLSDPPWTLAREHTRTGCFPSPISLSHSLTSFLGSPQINYLYSNLCLLVCFQGHPNQGTYFSHLAFHIKRHPKDWFFRYSGDQHGGCYWGSSNARAFLAARDERSWSLGSHAGRDLGRGQIVAPAKFRCHERPLFTER